MKLFVILAGMGLIFCTGNLLATDQASSEMQARNGGYYLLHHLLGQEADVDKVMLVKNGPPEIGRFTKSISALANEDLDKLDALQAKDKTLNFDENPLPAIENDVRGSIEGDKQHQLLFGTTGSAFVRALVVSQIEASMYAKHIAKVLADRAKSPRAQKALEKISEQWAHINDQAYTLLGSPVAR
jgi:hypothetical protein